MATYKHYSRLAGFLLLGGLGSLFLTLQFLPGFDARQEYFGGYFRTLVAMRESFGIALVIMILTGLLAAISGLALIAAFQRAGTPRSFSGAGLVGAGEGFILAGMLGLPALRILSRASEAAISDWQVLTREAYPWASSSQTVLIFLAWEGLPLVCLSPDGL